MPRPTATLAAPASDRQPIRASPSLPSRARHDICRLRTAPGATKDYSILSIDLLPPQSADDVTAAHEVVQSWIELGRPLIVTRHTPDCRAARCRLAFCGPRDASPRRICIEVACDAIDDVAPLRLRDALDAAPDAWRSALQKIDRAFGELSLTPCVFGSLAWQAATGLSYLHDASDVDLIVELTADDWQCAFTSDGGLSSVFSVVTAAMDQAEFRCDCELRLQRDAAFSLAELRGSSRQVMAKRNDGSELVARSSLRELATC
jgi:phosphoribosyl-dephospho-CoA transferase